MELAKSDCHTPPQGQDNTTADELFSVFQLNRGLGTQRWKGITHSLRG